jgi:hypothetical protein
MVICISYEQVTSRIEANAGGFGNNDCEARIRI